MDSKLIKHKAFKPVLLKDYLLEEMNSCSSNGFKSFPRRQCCTTTVRFLVEIDLKQRHKKYFIFNKATATPPSFLKTPSKSAISAFRSVIAAVKRLPFAAAASPAGKNTKLKKSILPSMEIVKKNIFWKRKVNREEIQRWKSLDQLLKEGSEPALDITPISSSDSSSEVTLDFTEVKRNDDDGVEEIKLENGDVSGDSASSSDGGATVSTEQKQWASNEEKQQFSPVSVLDCPFQDDEEVSSSNFLLMQGSLTTKKLMEKIQRFGNLDQLEPLNLAKRFALLPDSDNESTRSPPPHSSSSVATSSIEEDEEKALDLLNQLVDTLPSYSHKVKTEKLLLDFFREKIMHSQQGHSFNDDVVLEEAENWINGRQIREPFLGWEVQRNRQAYMNDMEKCGEWKCLDQEIGVVALELEDVVFDALFDELLVDISSTTTV